MKSTNILLGIIIVLLLINTVQTPFIHLPVIRIFNGSLTIFDILSIGILLWISSRFGSPIRELTGLIILIWLLSALGFFFFIGWFSNILLLAIILLLIASFF